jgi:predicted DNA-binding transcriptional regulator AlpA
VTTEPVWLHEKQVLGILGIHQSTLSRMRRLGIGPPYYKVSQRLIRYKQHEVEEWLKQNRGGGDGKSRNAPRVEHARP